jgi:hypothetical protein
MEYELARELKDAGFPQKDIMAGGVSYIANSNDQHPNPCYFPTLSELIEACGSRNFILGSNIYNREQNPIPKWDAQIYDYKTRTIGTGATSEEAVARLWLALNPKKV